MTAPGELSYWIADCWSDDPAKDKLEARIDQAFERIYDALPSRINLLDQADQREAHLVLLMVAQHCHSEALKGDKAQRALRVFTEKQMREGYAQSAILRELDSEIKAISDLQGQRDEAKRRKCLIELSGEIQLELMEAVK